MRKSTQKPRRKKAPKRVLALTDLEHSKAAVLNSLTSASVKKPRRYPSASRAFDGTMFGPLRVVGSSARGHPFGR